MAQALAGETLQFEAKPQVVKPRPKYRPQPVQEQQNPSENLPSNIMFDKRVVRGNTYANSQTTGDKKLTTLKQFKKPPQKTIAPAQPNYANATTPRALPGRVNLGLQTDDYIETLADKPPEQEMDAQTDFYIDKPPPRLFKPKKNGVDKETQIWENDLFDFDKEVEPILQVLMNKILEQSRMEVLEEEELKKMKEQQKEQEKSRNPMLSEMQRLEAVQQRMDSEEQRRKLQYETVLKQQELSHQKIISRQLSKQLIKPLKKNTFRILQDLGVFRDPLEGALLDDFLPWMFDGISSELQGENTTNIDLDGLLQNVEREVQMEHFRFVENRRLFIENHYKEIERKKQEKEDFKRQAEEERLKAIEDENIRLQEEANQEAGLNRDSQNNSISQP